jgi:hypothetical protein
MRHRLAVLALSTVVLGCTSAVYTLPEAVTPDAAPQRYDLEIPLDLDVKSVDFSIAAYSDVSQFNGAASTSLAGRSFIKVYAVHRKTGEQFLLLYEDAAHRRSPIQVIRFVPAVDRTRPESTN